MAPRKPRSTKTTTGLLDAIAFIEPACKEDGQDWETHCILSHRWVMGFNGALTAAHPIVEELTAFPRMHTLKLALSKGEGALAITQDTNGFLKVSTARMTVDVPCLPGLEWPRGPDQQSVQMDPAKEAAFKEALGYLNAVVKEAGETIMGSAVKIAENGMIASDGNIIMEYWHGLGFPAGTVLTVPKGFVAALAKTTRPIVGFGFSENSLTAYFAPVTEGGPSPWLKTQLYTETYPDTDKIWGMVDFTKLVALSEHFFPAVETVTRFSDAVRIYPDRIVSDDDRTASYDVSAHAGGDALVRTSGKRLKLCKFADKIVIEAGTLKPILLVGGMYRAVISTMRAAA